MSGIDAPQPWHDGDKLTWLRRVNIKHHGTPYTPVSGIDASKTWDAITGKRYMPPAVPPPNGTRFPCPLCGCKPGERHLRERRNSIHAHAYGGDPEDVALD